jgi:RND family efflux transporter MFP subunit
MTTMHSRLIVLVALAACSDSDEAPPAAPVAPAAPHVAPAPAPLVGVLAARTSNVVAAQIDGRIQRIAVTSGQRVHTGDLIAEIDATVLAEKLRAATASVDAARADVAGAGAEVSEANRQIALERRMFAAGASAEESVRLAKASLARAAAGASRAEASLREAEASRASLQAEMGHTTVVAPIDGVVSLVKAQPGEVVVPGAILARVFDPAKLMVRFQVTRARRNDVAIGTTVALHVPGVDHDVLAQVTSVSADLEPPLDFAVAEADVTSDAHDVQVGTVGDVRVTK